MQNSPNTETSYTASRTRFVEMAEKCGAELRRYPHPLKGLQGETLYTDVATLPQPDTKKWLVSVSGTPCVEAFCGFIWQTPYLEHRPSRTTGRPVALIMMSMTTPRAPSCK